MKKQLIRKLSWLLAVGCVSALAFTACKSTSEHPGSPEHPKKTEHPK
jgi:hypothetical protein